MNNTQTKVPNWKHNNSTYEIPVVDFDGDDSTLPDEKQQKKEKKEEKVDLLKSLCNKIKNFGENIFHKPVAQPYVNCQKKETMKADKVLDNGTGKQPSPKNTKKEPCSMSGIKISKNARDYDLIIPTVYKGCTSDDLEIVAGFNKHHGLVEVTVNGLNGPCTEGHKNYVIDFNDYYISKNDSKVEFPAFSLHKFNLFPWTPAINKYQISVNTCDSSIYSNILVYPDTKWNITISTKMDKKKIDDITIEGDYYEDQNKLHFKASSKKKEVDITFEDDDRKVGVSTSKKGSSFYYADDDRISGISAGKRGSSVYYKDSSSEIDLGYLTNENKLTGKDSFSAGTVEAANTLEKEFNKINSPFSSKTKGPKKEETENDDPETTLSAVKIEKAKIQVGDIKLEFNQNLIKLFNSLSQLVELVNFIQEIMELISESTGSTIECTIDWPCITLSGDWGWQEIRGSPKCGFEYKIKGNINPIIGAEVNVDILGAALTSIPVFGFIINIIVNVFEKVTGNDFVINFSLSGKFSYDIDITKSAAALNPTINSLPLQADLVAVLVASVHLTESVWIIGYGGGIEGAAKLHFDVHKPVIKNDDGSARNKSATEDQSGVFIPCDLQFMGITITLWSYVNPARSELTDIMPWDDGTYNSNEDLDPVEKEKWKELKDWLKSDKKTIEFQII